MEDHFIDPILLREHTSKYCERELLKLQMMQEKLLRIDNIGWEQRNTIYNDWKHMYHIIKNIRETLLVYAEQIEIASIGAENKFVESKNEIISLFS